MGIALWSTAGLHCEAMWRDVVWYYVNPCEIANCEAFLDQIEIDWSDFNWSNSPAKRRKDKERQRAQEEEDGSMKW